MEEKLQRLEKEAEKKKTMLGQTGVKTNIPKGIRDDDDYLGQKNRQAVGIEKTASQKPDIERLKS